MTTEILFKSCKSQAGYVDICICWQYQFLSGLSTLWHVQYHPRRGDALMFMSIHPNGTFDKHALHGGCPVIKGEKMVMTR